MLNPSKNRINYGETLYYGNNYAMDFAIGTTYSLNLDSLINAIISLDLYEEFNSDLINKPIFLLKQLIKLSSNISLFYENGQISLPQNRRKIYILLENMLCPVSKSEFQYNHYASFHPKFWLIRYKKDDDIRYRIIVLSRNLTDNRSWDVSFTMDGKLSNEETHKNDAIITFIKYLIGKSNNPEKTDKMTEIFKELRYVHFDLDSNIFSDFEFIVNGVNDNRFLIQNQPLFKKDFDRILIMSPFLSNNVISKFNKRVNPKSNSILISQANSLDKINPKEFNNFETYVLRDEIVMGEGYDSEDEYDFFKQDIHAKIYICEKDNSCDLYLGSLNASTNALEVNTELMIKLHAEGLTIEQIKYDIFNGERENPFELYKIKQEILKEDKNEDLDYIKQIVRLKSKAKVIFNNEHYNLIVEFEDNPFKDLEIRIRPYFSNQAPQKFSKKIIFENLGKLQLSEFFVITINETSKIIQIKQEGMSEDRQNEVVSEIIKKKEDFIEYVALLFGDDYYFNVSKSNIKKNSSIDNFYINFVDLYEKMLKASLYNPEKFDEIDFIIKSLSKENIVPEGFNELYNIFLEVIQNEDSS